MKVILRSLCLVLIPSGMASAQVVQQPVVGSFGVATTVSVPDGGQALLGSIGTAGSGRTLTGPFRSGTNYGMFGAHSSASVSVTVHDFEAMDALLLGTAESSERGVTESRATQAWQSLTRRRTGVNRITEGRSSAREPTAVERHLANDARAVKSLMLGRRAEDRGDINVARLHYRMAAKYGSSAAATRLDVLDEQTVANRDHHR